MPTCLVFRVGGSINLFLPTPVMFFISRSAMLLSGVCCWAQGIQYLINRDVLEDCPLAIAEFIYHTKTLKWQSLDRYLQSRPDVLDVLVNLHDFSNIFLPDALRTFFSNIPAPNERGRFLENLLEKFSVRYVQCNQVGSMSKGKV